MRHEKEENMKKTRLEESLKKEKQWDLCRECYKLLEENKTRWLERRESEKQKILEIEKEDRLQQAKNNKWKEKQRKETKPEYSRRLEEEQRLKGKQKMMSNLWKQRREADGRLVTTWNVMKKKLTGDQEEENSCMFASHEEGDDRTGTDTEPWEEEIVLSETERRKLTELEEWYAEHWKKNQPGGTSSQEEQDSPVPREGKGTVPTVNMCEGDQLCTLEPNQPLGRPDQPSGTPEMTGGCQADQPRSCQDGSQADGRHAHTIIQPTTKQVAVVRQVDLPINNRFDPVLNNYHPGPYQENDQPGGRFSLEEGDGYQKYARDPLDDQLCTLEPNLPPGTIAPPQGTHLQPQGIAETPARGYQEDGEHAETSNARIRQPTTIQVAVARYVVLPFNSNVEQIITCSRTGPSTGDKQVQDCDNKQHCVPAPSHSLTSTKNSPHPTPNKNRTSGLQQSLKGPD